MTSQKQISLFTEEQLTFLLADSLVNHTHPQESDSVKRIRDISGLRCLEQFERFSRPTSWAKMFVGLLIGTEGWYSTRCKLIWKLKATKSHRFYFQLVPSTLPTEGTEFGLLPTPLAQAREQKSFDKYDQRMERLVEKGHKPFTMPLDQMALRGLLPTPQASDFVSTVRDNDYSLRHLEHQSGWVKKMLPTPKAMMPKESQNSTIINGRIVRKSGQDFGMNLEVMAQFKMLPTPTASDKNGGVTRPTERLQYGTSLVNHMHGLTNGISGKTSQLAPQFVMEMMGFPTDWTELPFLNGDKNQSKQEETQSSLK